MTQKIRYEEIEKFFIYNAKANYLEKMLFHNELFKNSDNAKFKKWYDNIEQKAWNEILEQQNESHS